MNPFKNVFRSKKAKSLDLLSNFVRASKSTSSISVETVDLDATNTSTEASEWDTEVDLEEDKTFQKEDDDDDDNEADETLRSPVPPDIEPDWSSLPLVTFSREVYEAPNDEREPYCNLVLIVVADLHRVLSLKLPRYIVALMSNYRYLNGTSGKIQQVQQLDLYLSNVQEYLDIIRNLEAFEYQKMLHNCCKAISVLASILELCAVHASRDIFFLSFQQQTIAAFGVQYLCDFNIQIEYLQYLVPDNQRNEPDLAQPEVELADISIQTDSFLQVISEEPDLVHTEVQTDIELHSTDLGNPRFSLEEKLVETLENHHEQNAAFSAELIAMVADTVQTYTANFGAVLDDYTDSIRRKLDDTRERVERVRIVKEGVVREVLKKDVYFRRLLHELVSRDATLSATKNEKHLLERRLTDLQSHNNKLTQEKANFEGDLEDRIKELANQLREEKEQKRELASHNVTLSQQVLHLDEQLDESKETISDLKIAQQALAEELADKADHERSLQKSNESLEQRVEVLQADLYNQGQTLNLSQQENATLLSRCATLESNGNCQQAVASVVRKKDELLRKLQAGLAAAIADGNEMRSDICELKKQRKALNATMKQKEEAIETLHEKIEHLQSSIGQKDSAVSQLEQFAQCQDQELNTALQRVELKEQAIMTLQNKLEQSSQQISSLQSTQKALERNIDDVLQQLNCVQDEKEEVECLVRDLTSRNALLLEELLKLTIQHHEHKPVVQVIQDTEQVAQLESQLHSLQRAIEHCVAVSVGQSQTEDDQKELLTATTQTDDTVLTLDDSPKVLDDVDQRVKKLTAQLEEERNVLRATEYGKECLTLKVFGLQSDKTACEARIKDLQSTLSQTLSTHSHETESLQSDFQAKLYDARCRLAQKGQELEFARIIADKLIKRTDELSTELTRCVTAKTHVEQRLVLLKDQASREIDELELQIKALKGHKPQFEDKHTLTDPIQSQVSLVQTSLSFEYGYDLESGAQLRNDLYVSSLSHKDVQVNPRLFSHDASVQITPLTSSLSTQTNVDNRGATSQTDETDIVTRKVVSVQTDDLDADTRYSQTNQVETTNVMSQTVDEDLIDINSSNSLDLLKLLDMDNIPSKVNSGSHEGHSKLTANINLNEKLVQPQASFSWPATHTTSQLASSSLSAIGGPSTPVSLTPLKPVVEKSSDKSDQSGDYNRDVNTPNDHRIEESKSHVEAAKTAEAATSVASFRVRTPKKLISKRQISVLDSRKKGHSLPQRSPKKVRTVERLSTVCDSDDLSISDLSRRSLSILGESQLPDFSNMELKPKEVRNKGDSSVQPKRSYEVITSKSSSHDVCQFLYDIMSKEAATRDILIDISNGLDYSLQDEIFDRQFTQKFLLAFDKHHVVRGLLYQQDNIDNVDDLIHRLRTSVKNPKETDRQYPGKFERRINVEISEMLKKFFVQFIPDQKKIENKFNTLEDFNAYFARCFLLLSPASNNLKKTFWHVRELVGKLPYDKRHLSFATFALKFACKSNKLRDIVKYETGRDPEQTFQKYRLALDRRKHSTGLDCPSLDRRNYSVSAFFGFGE